MTPGRTGTRGNDRSHGALATPAPAVDEAGRQACVLQERAERLANRGVGRRKLDSAVVTLTFPIGEERYGLALTEMLCVVRARPLGPVPGARATVAGALFERADLWVIHDFRRLLGLPAPESTPGAFLLLRHPSDRVGIAIDDVDRIREIATSDLADLPVAAAATESSILAGVTGDGLIVVDADALRQRISNTEAT